MKILLVNDYGVPAGGAERITVDLRDGLRGRGHDARIFATTARPFPLPNDADAVCFGTNGWPQRLLQVWNPAAVRGLRRMLSAFAPDVVHVRMFLMQLSPAILPLFERVPTLLHVGNYQTICPLNSRVLPDGSRCTVRAGLACYREGCVSALGLARTVAQFALWRRRERVFRAVVANSRAVADALTANGVEVTTVVRNGTRIVPARPPLADPPTVAFAGRLVAQKGLEVLVDAMARVRRSRSGVRVIVAGDGPDRQRLERVIAAHSLTDSVVLLGHLAFADLHERLAGAWVQVVPSRYGEGSANVIGEAMMRGTAVVASRTGGAHELVREGVTGFLVPANDPGELAERLLALVGNRSLAEAMGDAGRRAALAELTIDGMIDRFEDVYREIRGDSWSIRRGA
jgi:glycosyltransferase involved in cell wall biosynthesis